MEYPKLRQSTLIPIARAETRAMMGLTQSWILKGVPSTDVQAGVVFDESIVKVSPHPPFGRKGNEAKKAKIDQAKSFRHSR